MFASAQQFTRYPQVNHSSSAQHWLEVQEHLQLAPKTLDAYARSLDDYLGFCLRRAIPVEEASVEHIADYVHDLATRPNPRGAGILQLQSRAGLSNATMQLRLTAVRLFYDFLVERGARPTNPVARGTYTPGKSFGGERVRALIPHYQKLPWIPTDDDWQRVLEALRVESLRNQVMLLLAYEGALRREELVSLHVGDIDPAYRQITVRAETTKGRRSRIVFYSPGTGRLLGAYLHTRRALSRAPGPLFLSESRRNRAHPLSARMWSHIVTGIASRSGVPRFTTHTPRHLRLTHLARAHVDLHHIATYAGHVCLQTTMLYIHLSGRDLAEAVTRSLADIDRWIETILCENRKLPDTSDTNTDADPATE